MWKKKMGMKGRQWYVEKYGTIGQWNTPSRTWTGRQGGHSTIQQKMDNLEYYGICIVFR
jgi:hypothetical protein